MLKKLKHLKRRWYILFGTLLIIGIFLLWYSFQKPPLTGDWQDKVAVQSTAEFKGDLVTVKNIRNFKYPDGTENNPVISYYDKTYDLSTLKNIWYITEPFKPGAAVAHTFLSFEFSTGDYLSITIESRLRKDQVYGPYVGMLHSYPLIYIAADEKDAIYLRANIRKNNVYMYPVKTTPDRARLILVDMLEKMNDPTIHPQWYHSLFANCTSMIAYHVNKVFPHRLPWISWKVWLTGYADELALDKGILDTNLTLEQAREKYFITSKSQKIGYVKDYSKLIREFDK